MLTVSGAMTSMEPGKPFDRGSALEVLRVFLRLGLSSFGGPIAHIGYFRDEFVMRRRWLDAQAYAGLVLCRAAPAPAEGHVALPVSRGVGAFALAAFSILLACVLLLAGRLASQGFDLFAAFYRSGALVFGGGHVVLPLLREAFVTPGWISDDAFLAGYGAAQAVPGPLFTFAAYLGAVTKVGPDGVFGAILGLIGI